MTTTSGILNESLERIHGAKIELFQIDMSLYGGETVYFTNDGTDITFDGDVYTPIPIKIEEVEISNTGELPRASLTLSNVNKQLLAEIIEYKDLLDCTVTYIKTFENFIASGNSYAPQIYKIYHKDTHDNKIITFTLVSPFDKQSIKIPKGVFIGVCQHTYRKYIDGSFVYGTCPYNDSDYYDEYDEATTAANDICNHQLSGCEMRYGLHQPLPFYGFPGVGSIR